MEKGREKDKMNQFLKKKILGKFEIEESVLNQFCEENAKIWKQNEQKENGNIFIGLFMVEKWMPWITQKLIFAKGLGDRTGKKPIVVDWEYNENLEKLYGSYGIDLISLKKEMFGNLTGCLYGLAKAVQFFLFDGTGAGMIEMKYKGGRVGQFMYDTVIRTNQDIYTIRKARNKVCFKKIWTTYWFMNSLNKLYQKYRPEYYIFDDLIYDEGMIVEYMRKQGSKVINGTMDSRLLVPDYTEDTVHWPDFDKYIMEQVLNGLSDEEKEAYVKQAENALYDRFHGKNGDARDSKAAFTGKKECSREELVKVMGLDPNKKNVVFCSHTLAESAHRCSKQAYQDTYTWMEETMKFVRDNDSANWIIKVHPVAALKYGEGNVLESLYEKYKSDNLFLFPDEYNSALVGKLADVVVTIYGNAGSEYSCLGIPVILSGNAVYSGMGYTIDAFTREAYEKVLSNINEIKPMTEEQMRTAKLVFTYLSRRINQDLDEFSEKMIALNWKFDAEMMAGNSVKNLNSETISFISDYSKEKNIKETKWYQNGQRQEEYVR